MNIEGEKRRLKGIPPFWRWRSTTDRKYAQRLLRDGWQADPDWPLPLAEKTGFWRLRRNWAKDNALTARIVAAHKTAISLDVLAETEEVSADTEEARPVSLRYLSVAADERDASSRWTGHQRYADPIRVRDLVGEFRDALAARRWLSDLLDPAHCVIVRLVDEALASHSVKRARVWVDREIARRAACRLPPCQCPPPVDKYSYDVRAA